MFSQAGFVLFVSEGWKNGVFVVIYIVCIDL